MIGRKSLFIFISRTISRLFEGIIYLIAVSKFTPILFGYQQIALSFMGFFSLFSILGLETPHLKIMTDQTRFNKNEAFSTFLVIEICLITISAIIIFITFAFQLNSGLISNILELKYIFIIVFIQFLLRSFNLVFELSYRSQMNVVRTEIPFIIGHFIFFLSSLISILFLKNFILFLICYVLIELIRLIFFLFSKRSFHFTQFKFNIFKQYIKLNLIFMIPLIINTLITNLGIFFFLKSYSEELLGIYSVISMIFLVIQSLEQAFRSLLIPNFTNLLEKNDLTRIRESINLFEKYMTILNGFLILGGIFFAEIFISKLLGNIYFEKGGLFFFGCLLSLLSFPLIVPYYPLLIVTEKFKLYNLLAVLSFLFSLISWIFFIPIFDIVGINLGLWLAFFPVTIILRVYCQKHFGVGKIGKKQIFHLILLVFLFIIAFYCSTLNLSFFLTIVILVAVLTIYFIFLLIAKILTKKDLRFFLDILNPKKMMDHIKFNNNT
ncbi:lipopolysaccharide biosynthesis protein [Promethearchaeum syntrophicum]|uniref:Lipopolysaccharide biosynthesis protein n=1 Tax=Promethearchaeum syntrophicum TaxID=2594042 RepID=A0A5B9DBJ9_9ARCH|nr:lipopolysaccharide biosynthesis protein [Candidatus Prometheoarchaeum syntrophicum]QEE16036.1 hypothetical protein DSAG12_01864 [Candidatus Prometheoarchaeum syntrophicum]